jgi:hypothetical protein
MTAGGRPKGRDPLLIAARLIITLMLGLLVLAGAAMVLGAPAVVALRQVVLAELARHAGHAVGGDIIGWIGMTMVLLAVIAALAFRFLLLLRRIIDSVAVGDSFAPVNARRLTQMGWLSVAIQVLSIPVGALAHWIDAAVRGGGRPEFGVGLGGVLMALLLFVLARVFREGSRMREDLEGTV